MLRLVSYDISAFIILLILFAASFFRRMNKGKSNHWFLALITICLLSCIFDIAASYYDIMADPAQHDIHFLYHTIHLFLNNLIPPVYFMYAIAQTDTFHMFGTHRAELSYVIIPSVFFAIIFTVNFFNGMVFDITDGVYSRGPFMGVLYIIAGAYAIGCVFYLLIYRKLFTRSRLAAFLSLFPLLGTSVLIQYFFPTLRLEMFGVSLSLLFIAIFIQRPEALIDYNTGIYKFNAYAMDMKRNFLNQKPVDVILINLSNYLSLQEILSYDGINDMLKLVAKTLNDINDHSKIKADLYYLDKGRFRVVIGSTNHEKTAFTAEAINAALKPKLPLNGMEISLVPYICTARCPDDISDFNTLIEFGKDLSAKFRYTGKVMQAAELLDRSRYDLMSELDRIIADAVRENKFEVYYQPIYSIVEKKFISAEALVRLRDEKYGFISPELFIPVTEKSGVVNKIGLYVFEEVCKFISSEDFKDLGLQYIEVNLSIVQCMQSGLAGDLLSIMKKYGVKPDQINLEITESADAQTQIIIAENLTALLNAGLTFSLDDFGTGYSNMQRMASLPLKIVKLDKTFVNFDDNPRLMIVLQNTVKMLKAMNMEIVVEGVETQELVDRFTKLDCEYIQGFFYSRPIPKKEFIEFIRNSLSRHETTTVIA